MKTFRKLLVFLLVFTPFLLSTGAQTAPIDPALLARATAGDAAAQVAIGEQYAAQAANLYSEADAAAACKTAAAWYRKAAGNADLSGRLAGYLHLAALYRDGGTGFPRDMVQAAAWYGKAAEMGDVDAQGTLGVLYSIGQGVPQSYVEAFYWLDLAAAVKGPRQQQYSANRQMIGTHLTVDEVAGIERRVAKWLATHPHQGHAG